MKIPKSVIDLILPSTRSPLLWVSANCCHGLFLHCFRPREITTTFFVDIQNHHFHYITNVNNFGWVDVFVGPVHFGNVHQTFNAFFDFNEAAVVSQVGNATSQFSTFWVTLSDSYPWIFAQLFQAEGYTSTLAVELQHFNSDFVAHVHDFAWVLNAFPRHVGDVQQAINAAQVNECAVVSEVLNDTFDFHCLPAGFPAA
ncbi:hypothetical protein HR12_28240, partial [Microbacterium sp. SUBG005]